ncbi:MAG TPA: preprotein translocase subunit SecG [Candidatus Polarisedimenticolia bacterium]|nr:preprotein translocase subunit SecG [Candidatus Polarisedimenticolia bacterium]
MYAALIVLHFFVCLILILVVLLQTGKGADLAGAFGGGGSQTALGSRGAATVLSKATTIAAIVFMFTSLALALYSSRRTSDVLQNAPAAATSLPVVPPPAPNAASPAAPAGTAPATKGTQPPANQPAQAPPSTPEPKKP